MSAATTPASEPVLVIDGVTKRFGSTVALDDVSFRLRRGSVHALLGENGAGKTTLMRVAFGLVAADAGTVRVPDRGVTIGSVAQAIASGLGMVHQHFSNVPVMTVAENVALGAEPGRRRFVAARARQTVRDIGSRTGLALDPDIRAEELSVGGQQRLEIVKALTRGARVLILDEPTAVLAPAEAGELLRWLRAFADVGNSVVLITHKLREALAVADDITVLRRGRVVLAMPASTATVDSLSAALLGEAETEVPAASATADEMGPEPERGGTVAPDATRLRPEREREGDVVVRADRVSIVDARGVIVVREATFSIHAGEILGVAGVEGAGQAHLLRAVAGRLRISSGTLRRPPVVGFAPEDRHRDALILDFSLAENVALRGAGYRHGLVPWRAVHERTAALMSAYDVRGGTERSPAAALSGGNQQKLVLAREIDTEPVLLVVENPTRGLDIRATRAVLDRLRAAARAGAAVMLYSSDLDEVLTVATRLVVLHAGTLTEQPKDREKVGRAMLGVTSR